MAAKAPPHSPTPTPRSRHSGAAGPPTGDPASSTRAAASADPASTQAAIVRRRRREEPRHHAGRDGGQHEGGRDPLPGGRPPTVGASAPRTHPLVRSSPPPASPLRARKVGIAGSANRSAHRRHATLLLVSAAEQSRSVTPREEAADPPCVRPDGAWRPDAAGRWPTSAWSAVAAARREAPPPAARTAVRAPAPGCAAASARRRQRPAPRRRTAPGAAPADAVRARASRRCRSAPRRACRRCWRAVRRDRRSG